MNYINLKNNIDRYLKKSLSAKRYSHSVEVARMSEKIARNNCLDENKAYIAGLSHDIAREKSLRFLNNSIRDCKGFSDAFYLKPMVFHGPVGASILLKEFLVTDSDILEAVTYHSIGNCGIGRLAKVVYVADYISLDRIHVKESFRSFIFNQELDDMVLLVVDACRDYLKSKNNDLLPETENMYNNIVRIRSEKKEGI